MTRFLTSRNRMRTVGPRSAARILASVGVVIVLTHAAFGQTASYQGLGQMPGTMSGAGTYVNAVSGDGSTLVGYTWISGSATRPFRWTAAGGFEDLGHLGGGNSSNNRADAVSFDGSVVVGTSTRPDQLVRAFRWTVAGGMQEIQMGQELSQDASGVSADGSIVVGKNIRWTFPGQIDIIPYLGGNNVTYAVGVSADGQVVAGHSETSPNRYFHAYRWTPSGGIQDLGVTNGTESLGWGISANGALVFGEARDSQGFWRAFRWTSSLGMRDMGTLGGPMSTSHGASFDGSVIVGKSLINSQSSSLRAFRWTAATGMRDLRQELINAGVTGLGSWTLAVAADISDNGLVIVGWGYPASLTPAQPFIATFGGSGGGVSLSSLSLNPTTVTGGSLSTGTATLSGAAPSGGQVVTLSSSNSAVATVPSSVTVAAGATSANFSVSTNAVATSTNVTISGVSGGVTKTSVLTVSPAGGGGGDTGLRSPTANAANSGGDGNGFESNPANAHTADGVSALDNNSGSSTSTSCTGSSKDKHRFYNYGFTFPTGVSIRGIEVRLDAKADSSSSSPKMCVQLSWNGGSSWTSTKSTPTLGSSLTTFMLGSPSDTWGRSWSTGDFNNANFRVRVIDVSSSTSRDFSLDWVAVRVHY